MRKVRRSRAWKPLSIEQLLVAWVRCAGSRGWLAAGMLALACGFAPAASAETESEAEPAATQEPPAAGAQPSTEPPAARAQPSIEPPAEGEERWAPLLPKKMKKDWVRLVSGEWLRGDLELLRDDTLEFESDELDDQKLDWDDVLELYSPHLNTWVFEGPPDGSSRRFVRAGDQFERIGTGVVKDGKVRLIVDGVEQVHPRSDLLAIIPGAPREFNYWSFLAGLSLGAQSGNTDQVDIGLNATIRREGPSTRTVVEYRGAIGTLDDEQNTNNHRASGKFDWFLSRRFYLTPIFLEAFHDRFQNIQLRLTPGSGVGYKVMDSKRIDWDFEAGLAGQYLRYDTVSAGRDRSNWNGVARFGTRIETEITSRIDFDVDYIFDLAFPDTGSSSHHSTSVLSVELTKIFDLDVTFVFDRTEDPEADSDGDVPEKNDLRLTVGFSIDY